VSSAQEIFHMRIGVLKLRQKWLDREVSPSLTLTVGIALVMGGFVMGVVVGGLFSMPGHLSVLVFP